jgi:GH24 family phage-related lysozyme (muramidase)
MIWFLLWLSLASPSKPQYGKRLHFEPAKVDTSYNYAVRVIKKYEGFRSKPYRLFEDNYKGYGHLIYTDFSPVDEVQADSILRADLDGKFRQIHLKMDRKTRLLLAVYAYNCGNARKLYKYVGKPEFRGKYLSSVYANGKVLPGLKKRRIDELKILDL